MGTELSVPIAGNNSRVRDQILLILSNEYPLSVKQLYTRITRQGHSVSYQAVHKVVTQLIEEGILNKDAKNLQLSKNWISQVKDYVMAIDMMYTKGNHHRLPKKIDKTVKLTFDDISTYTVWMAENLRDGNFTLGKPQPVFGMFYHAVWPLRFNFMDFETLRSMTANCPTRGFCTSDMPLDRWIHRHYKLAGVLDFKTGVKTELHDDFFAVGDVVIRAEFSPETRKYMDNVYSKIGDLKELFNHYFLQERKNEPTLITVTIEKNPTMTKMIESKVLHELQAKETKGRLKK